MTRPREPEDRAGLHAVDVSDVLLHPLSPRERAAFTRTSSERALARYEARRAEITFTNAVLEGSTFTLSEVRILLDGITPEGRRITEVLEVSNLGGQSICCTTTLPLGISRSTSCTCSATTPP